MSQPSPSGGPVLACFAHPDDAEISSGGALAKFAGQGREVHLLVLTNGDRGSNDPAMDREELARTRTDEVMEAGRVLGLARVRLLGTHDGELANDPAVRSEIARDIREIRPTTVVTCDPTAWFFEVGDPPSAFFNHADHRRAGEATLDASFPGAGNPHYFTEQLAEGLQAWDVSEVWLGWTNEPNHAEDVTGYFQTKVDALAKHASQLAEGIRFFEEFMGDEARRAGARIGVEHAEEFRVVHLD
jgi:LmbE family N-acetylglucosaminyl deacetylase